MVAGKEELLLIQQRHAARRMTGGVNRVDFLSPQSKGVTIIELARGWSNSTLRRGRRRGTGAARDFCGGGDVIGVGMCFDYPF